MMLWLVMLLALASGQDAVAPPSPETDTPVVASPPRVIIYPSRLRSVRGYVIAETPERITVRDLEGDVHEFDTSLIFSEVRLHDLDEPRPAIALLHDGRRREGLLVEDGFTLVKMIIHDVPHEFDRDQVAVVRLLPTFAERYRLLRNQLDPEDPRAHLELCEWLVEQDRLTEARTELDHLLERHESELAQRLRRRVAARLALENSQASNPADEADVDRSPMPELVSADDVNLMRVYEIDLNDPPRLRVPPATVKRLFEHYGDSTLLPQTAEGRAAFARADPTTIVEVMFALRARELYGDIKVNSEPSTIRDFRTAVHDSWLINRCGSRACHGGSPETAGRFRLHRRQPLNDRVRASNLLTLHRVEIDGQPLLNWAEPEQSLLYQYALPRDQADTPHPDVPGFRPSLSQVESENRQAYLDWFNSMARNHHRDWPVDYEPWQPASAEPPAPSSGP